MSAHANPGSAPVILDRDRARARAEDLLSYVDASPMPHHAVAETERRLRAAGYQELREDAAWDLAPGDARYVIRGGSTILAFRLGTEAPSETGVRAVGAHVDSPNLRVKPVGETGRFGYRQLAVSMYGGAIVASWTDRDLGLAGRLIVQGSNGPESRLVTIRRPIARVPNLAIHLNRDVNKEGLRVNLQHHLPPVIGLGDSDWSVRRIVADAAGVDAGDVLDYDLGLFDVTPSTLGGLDEDFVFAPRLDNLGSSHAALTALLAAGEGNTPPESTPPESTPPESTWIVALYDHEECGSSSAQGAAGTLMRDVVARLASGHPAAGSNAAEELTRTTVRSLLISADMAHAVHPSHPEVHEPAHMPRMNRGPVIKRNVNQRYATDADTGSQFALLCRAAGFEPQQFVIRSDMGCGSTIGPISASRVGFPTVDVGNPMLSMHSVREMAGTWDHDLMIEALIRHFS